MTDAEEQIPWDSIAEAAHRKLTIIALTNGNKFEYGRYEPTGKFFECWTNSFDSEGEYCEGAVYVPDKKGWVSHGFVLIDGKVVERTEGYEDCRDYRGWVLDRDKVQALESRTPEAHRVDGKYRMSVIESCLALRMTWVQIASRFMKGVPRAPLTS